MQNVHKLNNNLRNFETVRYRMSVSISH